MKDSQLYRSLGVSSAKADIVAAASQQGEGLFPGAFCKIVEDVLSGSPEHCLAFHADGAGTKAVVAYLLFREEGDPSVFASLAQDALVMNLDDLLCIGARGPFLVTNTIGRHRERLPAPGLEAILAGYQACVESLAAYGIEIVLCGGETADVGDLVRTLVVDATAACRLFRNQVIDGSKVRPGDVIVGLGSTGQTVYENAPNSGIGSNGLTLARHALLCEEYRRQYPEAVAPEVSTELAYRGPFRLSDRPADLGLTVGQALLSPTRTYAPLVVKLVSQMPSALHGVIHCTGGGQTKCLRLPGSVAFVKDNLFAPPPLFALVQQAAAVPWQEMYQVFNMGHRLELFLDPGAVQEVLSLAESLRIPAQVIGRCRPPDGGDRLRLHGPTGWLGFA